MQQAADARLQQAGERGLCLTPHSPCTKPCARTHLPHAATQRTRARSELAGQGILFENVLITPEYPEDAPNARMDYGYDQPPGWPSIIAPRNLPWTRVGVPPAQPPPPAVPTLLLSLRPGRVCMLPCPWAAPAPQTP